MPFPPDTYSEKEVDNHITGIIFALYYYLKKSIELFGDKAENATTKELKEICDMGTYHPQDAKELTKQDKPDGRELLSFITENKDGFIKIPKSAMGNKQRTFDGYDKRLEVLPQ